MPAPTPDNLAAESLTQFRERAQRIFHEQGERISAVQRAVAAALEAAERQEQAADAGEPGGDAELRRQLAGARKMLNARAEELKDLRTRLAAAGTSQEALAANDEINRLREAREQLEKRLTETERKLVVSETKSSDARVVSDLQKRFDGAVREIRELKEQNQRLREQAPGKSAKTAAAVFDWEHQKQRLMQELEDQEAPEDRDRLEAAILLTDQAVAEKDRQIAALQQQLERQGVTVSDSAGSTAAADILDQDEIVRQEREKLRQLQAEWQEKMRGAEVEVSLERAKLARERLELDERLRELDARPDHEPGQANGGDRNGKATRGRWLTRLGLKDGDSA